VAPPPLPRWRPTRRQLFWASVIAALAFLIIVICGYLFKWKWTGIVKASDFQSRTLWDWLQPLIIPAVIAGGGIWFNQQQRGRELEIEAQRAQDDTLQAYLDQMSHLMLLDEADGAKPKPLRKSGRKDEVRVLARARTLTVLRRLDSRRKRSVLDFLYEADLIKQHPETIIELGSLDYEYGAADLSGADLRGAVLRGANFSGSVTGASLSGADLRGADLTGAVLSNATLSNATLSNAILNGATLLETDLSGADLTGANGVIDDQLEQQALSLKGATMPNGQKYEDWLKSKGSGEE
jgi:uncharacterized protein YjbI with pentapeptide repeats